MNVKKGFTLIELLVVIAIIGLMASVVLASLNSARGKAANAAVKSNLAGVRAEAALFFDLNSTYFGVCDEGGVHTIGDNIRAALLAGGDIAYDPGNYDRCNGDNDGWVAISKLKVNEGSNNYFCVDSGGKAAPFDSLNLGPDGGAYLITGGLDATERCP